MARIARQAPWPVVVLVLSFLCPTELSVFVGSVRLPPHRAALLIMLPLALVRIFGRRGIKVQPFDIALMLFGVWTLIVYPLNHGIAEGVQPGGSLALDSVASFAVARAYVRDAAAFRATAALLVLSVAFCGALALPEAINGEHYAHDFMRQLTGSYHFVGYEKRFGLTRAYATFDHPIHLGTFCAVGLALALYSAKGMLSIATRSMLIGASTFLGLSSAPLLGLAIQGCATVAERATRGVKGRVRILIVLLGLLFLAAMAIASRSPFAVIATAFTIDKETGFYRLSIWQYCIENILRHPIIGIGTSDWDRPEWMFSSTIDAFWLVVPLRQGLPALLLLTGALVLLVRKVSLAMKRCDAEWRLLGTGWIISLMSLILVGFTVHYWNVPYAYFFFFVGLGAWIAEPRRLPQAAKSRPRAMVESPRLTWLAPGGAVAVSAGDLLANAALARWPVPPPKWPVPIKRSGPSGARRSSGVALRAPVGGRYIYDR